MSDVRIKTCDYCGAEGRMPTFMNGETTCYKCLAEAPKTLQEANHIIKDLQEQLKKRPDKKLVSLDDVSAAVDAIIETKNIINSIGEDK